MVENGTTVYILVENGTRVYVQMFMKMVLLSYWMIFEKLQEAFINVCLHDF